MLVLHRVHFGDAGDSGVTRVPDIVQTHRSMLLASRLRKLPGDLVERLTREPVVPELLEPLLRSARLELKLAIRRDALNKRVEPRVISDAVLWLRQILSELTNQLVLERF